MTEEIVCWEKLIGSRMRPCIALQIEDARERNTKLSRKRATKRWRERNLERVKEKQDEWRRNNPDKVKLYQQRNKKNVKAWAEAHHDRILELGRANDARRRQTEKRQNWKKEYRQRPEVKEKLREYDRKRNQTPERKAWEREYRKKRREQKKKEKQCLTTIDVKKS